MTRLNLLIYRYIYYQMAKCYASKESSTENITDNQYRKHHGQLVSLWEEYNAGSRSSSKLLKAVSYHISVYVQAHHILTACFRQIFYIGCLHTQTNHTYVIILIDCMFQTNILYRLFTQTNHTYVIISSLSLELSTYFCISLFI